MSYLLSALKAREKSSVSAAFLAIGLLAQAVGPSIKKHLPKISEAVRMSLPIKDAAAKSVQSASNSFFTDTCFVSYNNSFSFVLVLLHRVAIFGPETGPQLLQTLFFFLFLFLSLSDFQKFPKALSVWNQS